jgi:glycosyltransferase involved in cell wall biosynthesis
MSRTSHVTVCVPVYNGRAFVAETLAAIQQQSHEQLTVIMSDDASDDGSPDICRGFTRDSRFRLSIQPSRRGWIENCNWLLAQADSEFVCLLSHDDLPEPSYIARLVDLLESESKCAVAFTDMQVFGLLDNLVHQDSICGPSAIERVRTFIATHSDGTAFRGVIRRQALTLAGGLRGNEMDNFAADVSWAGRLAQAGDLRCVSEPLYRKRRHAASASLQWGHWTEETKADAWCMHCSELLRDAMSLNATLTERRLLVQAVLRRLLAIEPVLPFAFIRALPPPRQAAMVAAILGELRGLSAEVFQGLADQSHFV